MKALMGEEAEELSKKPWGIIQVPAQHAGYFNMAHHSRLSACFWESQYCIACSLASNILITPSLASRPFAVQWYQFAAQPLCPTRSCFAHSSLSGL